MRLPPFIKTAIWRSLGRPYVIAVLQGDSNTGKMEMAWEVFGHGQSLKLKKVMIDETLLDDAPALEKWVESNLLEADRWAAEHISVMGYPYGEAAELPSALFARLQSDRTGLVQGKGISADSRRPHTRGAPQRNRRGPPRHHRRRL